MTPGERHMKSMYAGIWGQRSSNLVAYSGELTSSGRQLGVLSGIG